MKIYLTKYSSKKLRGIGKGYLYVHYYQDCGKISADFIEDDIRIHNSGVVEIEIKKKILFLFFTKWDISVFVRNAKEGLLYKSTKIIFQLIMRTERRIKMSRLNSLSTL